MTDTGLIPSMVIVQAMRDRRWDNTSALVAQIRRVWLGWTQRLPAMPGLKGKP